ncbi:integrase, catalytic region, zinc finger, CCHC-type containing protein [Tanacetum coccineum]
MNASSKSKSVKKAKRKKEWKPTGKVFTKIGYNWRPTGRTFTLVGNAYPLTRITTTNKVPLREPIPLEVVVKESVVTKVYTRRPKVPKTNGSNSKPKIAKSVISNKTEPDTSRGSNTSVSSSSSSSVDLKFSACAMDKSKKQSHKPKSEDTNQEKLYLLHMDLCGPMRVASINEKKYILFIVDDYSQFTWVKFLASKEEAPDFIVKFLKMIQLGSGPGLQSITPATSSSRVVTNPIPQQPCNPPPRDDWDHLFQPMFDEYFNPLTIDVSPIPVANAPRAVDLADSPVSMSIDQDAPSTNIPSTQDQEHSPIISQANVIGDPSRSVSTRKQLQTDAMWCYLDAFLTSVEPKNFKQAMTEPSWIDAMQEEIHEFERLQVWELVSCHVDQTKMDLQGQDWRIWQGTKE